MSHFFNIISFIDSVLGSNPFLLTVFMLFFFIKSFILGILISKKIKSPNNNVLSYLLIFALLGSLGADFGWVYKLIRALFFPQSPYNIALFFVRMAWAFYFLQDISIALFIEHLVTNEHKLKIRHIIFIGISAFLAISILGIAFYHFNCHTAQDRSWLEIVLLKFGIVYLHFPLLITSLFFTMKKIWYASLPRLISKQLKLILFTVFGPFWLLEVLQYFPLKFAKDWVTNSYTFVSLSNLILTVGIFYCARKIVGLRFLNFQEQVAMPVNLNFVGHFKTVLEQFSHATSLHQLNHITQNFFKEAFNVPLNHTVLIIRNIQPSDKKDYNVPKEPIALAVEQFLVSHSKKVCTFIKNQKLLSYDEVAFSNFYEKAKEQKEVLTFLESINADIFLPIYEKDALIAYVIVDRLTRKQEFYSKAEYDEMLVFTSYLSNMITLLQNKDFEHIIQQEKTLKDELYSKHQEINQYKESIRSFLRSNKEKSIGIIFYKNRRFSLGNQAAKELIGINPNIQEGHPLSKALKQLAHKVESYKSSQTCFAKDAQGNKLVIDGVPSLEHNNIILLIYHPEIADLIKSEVNILKDPSHWDYLLYLETTKSGKLINQLIPGNGETLLNFKIMLLKTALSKKATLLDVPEEDLIPMVELIHHISLRETLYTLDVKHRSLTPDIAIKLFGLSSVYGIHHEKSILEQLHNNGTLFIKNVHYLDLETQKYLAEFIRYGFFKVFKTNHKILSNVRIICSTSQNLQQLVHEGTFSSELFQELSKTTLSMPSLMMLPEEELDSLAEAYSEQAVPNESFKQLLSLNEHDKLRISATRPVSLKGLRGKVQQILTQKSKKHNLHQEKATFEIHNVTDPELIEAIRLGKHALKDRKTFTMLWSKFKNQNKIATLLGVNRSSVNRRCKMYNLNE